MKTRNTSALLILISLSNLQSHASWNPFARFFSFSSLYLFLSLSSEAKSHSSSPSNLNLADESKNLHPSSGENNQPADHAKEEPKQGFIAWVTASIWSQLGWASKADINKAENTLNTNIATNKKVLEEYIETKSATISKKQAETDRLLEKQSYLASEVEETNKGLNSQLTEYKIAYKNNSSIVHQKLDTLDKEVVSIAQETKVAIEKANENNQTLNSLSKIPQEIKNQKKILIELQQESVAMNNAIRTIQQKNKILYDITAQHKYLLKALELCIKNAADHKNLRDTLQTLHNNAKNDFNLNVKKLESTRENKKFFRNLNNSAFVSSKVPPPFSPDIINNNNNVLGQITYEKN